VKIEAVGLRNFRGYKEVIAPLGPITMVRGENRAGKSTLQYGISWCLTGACSLTAIDGKNWEEPLRRKGSLEATVAACHVADIGSNVERHRVGKAHELFGVEQDNAKPAQVEPLLFKALGVSRETLLLLLDPRPFALRSPKEQRLLLTKLLRPAALRTPKEVKELGQDHIAGAADIQRLIKKWGLNGGMLSELGRERRKLEAQQPEKPTWPLSGKTQREFEENYNGLLGKRDEAATQVGAIEQRIATIKEALAKPPPEFLILTGEKLQELLTEQKRLKEELDRAKEILATADTAYTNALLAQQKANTEKQTQMRLIHQAEKVLAEKPVECEADACPVLRRFQADNEERLTEANKILGAATKAYHSADAREKEHRQTEEAARTAKLKQETVIGEHETKLTELEQSIREGLFERKREEAWRREHKEPDTLKAELANAEQELEEAKKTLTRLKGVVTQAEGTLTKVAEYETQLGRHDAHQRELAENVDKARKYRAAVDALEKMQAKILKDSGGDFMAQLNALMEGLPIPPIEFDWDQGFLAEGTPIESYLSDGQIQMILDPMLRATAARFTGAGIMCFDHRAPIVPKFSSAVTQRLIRSGVQVIQTVTSSETTRHPDTPEQVKILNVIYDPEGSRIEAAS
jgi:hypothetical protein